MHHWRFIGVSFNNINFFFSKIKFIYIYFSPIIIIAPLVNEKEFSKKTLKLYGFKNLKRVVK